MSTAFKFEPKDVDQIPYQEASLDIWEKKYRLTAKDGSAVDHTMDDTYRRVARALAEVEAPEQREQWFDLFLWAQQKGAIPAGRITSNAGALAHKPATSTINCTVSGTIRDSMDDILNKVHEAGLTLKAGCGIGYEFSTLRPRERVKAVGHANRWRCSGRELSSELVSPPLHCCRLLPGGLVTHFYRPFLLAATAATTLLVASLPAATPTLSSSSKRSVKTAVCANSTSPC